MYGFENAGLTFWTNVVIFGTNDIIMAKAYKIPGSRKKTDSTVPKSVRSPLKIAEAQAAYAPSDQARVIRFMGIGEKKEHKRQHDETFFIDMIRQGLPKKVMDHLLTKLDISEDEMASILHVSKRTLQRRSSQESLNEEQSERLIELAKLYSKGEEVIGDLEKFKEWMNSKTTALGNKRPKDFLDTSIGINILLDELGRIQHGIFA